MLDPAGTRRRGEQRVLELYRELFAGTVEITPEMRPRWKVPPGQLRHRLVPGVRFEWHKPLWHPTTVDLPEPQYDDMVAVYVHEWLAENIPRHRDKAPGTEPARDRRSAVRLTSRALVGRRCRWRCRRG